jgi:hypothetical protein
MNPHEEFLELGAAAGCGELTEEERRKLDEHLAGCVSCRATLKELHQTILMAIPALSNEVPQKEAESDAAWSAEKAEARLFARLDGDRPKMAPHGNATPGTSSGPHRAYFPSRIRWDLLGLSAAAMVLFSVGLGIHAYRATGSAESNAAKNDASALEERLADTSHDAKLLKAQLAEREQMISNLRQELERESIEEKELKAKMSASGAALQRKTDGDTASVAESQRLADRVKVAEARTVELHKEIGELEQRKSEESNRTEALEAKVATLTTELREKEEAIAGQTEFLRRQAEYLDHDRDIRELMGARDLYIAEIYDVERTGQTNKPYGRVFYTKGKSLVFYAYDLDQQAGLKEASTFQAWGGKRGENNRQAVNLGVFYEDNGTKKRWVVRSNDPKTLKEIDAVFVTVEPNGGSQHPSTEPLLFAYLRVHPNHP